MEAVRGVEAGRAGVSLSPGPIGEGFGAMSVEELGGCENVGDNPCAPWIGWGTWA